jgi:hypothetical protein
MRLIGYRSVYIEITIKHNGPVSLSLGSQDWHFTSWEQQIIVLDLGKYSGIWMAADVFLRQ